MFFFGNFLYITVLLINAVAILSEDRFLARSTFPPQRPTAGPSPYAALRELLEADNGATFWRRAWLENKK